MLSHFLDIYVNVSGERITIAIGADEENHSCYGPIAEFPEQYSTLWIRRAGFLSTEERAA